MLGATDLPVGFLDPITRVVEATLRATDRVGQDDIMLVGAWCRDVWHHSLGHTFATSRTYDIDIALALASWDGFDALTDSFDRASDSGLMFRIAEINVDVLPFRQGGGPGRRHPSSDTRCGAERLGILGDLLRFSSPRRQR